MNIYFYFDPEGDGFQTVPNLETAQTRAKAAIREYLDICWMEEVEGVCVGGVLERATKTVSKVRPDDSELDGEGYDSDGNWWGRMDDPEGETSEFDEICDFTLEPVGTSVLSSISTSDLVRELMTREGVTTYDAPDSDHEYDVGVRKWGDDNWKGERHDGPAKILVVVD